MTSRPGPPHEGFDGFEWVAVPDGGWRLETGKRCRWGAGYHHKACGRESVAELRRSHHSYRTGGRNAGRREQWWAYCGEHLYGRWIENGTVMHWILRELDSR